MNKTIHFTYMSLILTLFVLFIIGYIRQGDNKLIYESLKIRIIIIKYIVLI